MNQFYLNCRVDMTADEKLKTRGPAYTRTPDRASSLQDFGYMSRSLRLGPYGTQLNVPSNLGRLINHSVVLR